MVSRTSLYYFIGKGNTARRERKLLRRSRVSNEPFSFAAGFFVFGVSRRGAWRNIQTMAGKLPALKPKRIIRALERHGFSVHHTSGSHYIMKKERLRVTVPYHNKDLKPGTLKSIIEQAGLTVEEFLDLL